MIYAIWYPSGGGGHFLNSVISMRGHGFIRPDTMFSISAQGNAHRCALTAPPYHKEPNSYNFQFDSEHRNTVLIDNGINNEGTKFVDVFPTASVIKICYDDSSWPAIAQTCCVKAAESSINEFTKSRSYSWDSDEDWAIREQYFLFLRDNPLRFKWRASDWTHNINFSSFFNYEELRQQILNCNITIDDFNDLHQQWFQKNICYYQPVLIAEQVVDAILSKIHIDVSHVTDVWTQAVIYYFIWLHFGIEVPHNDYANFVTNTSQLSEIIK